MTEEKQENTDSSRESKQADAAPNDKTSSNSSPTDPTSAEGHGKSMPSKSEVTDEPDSGPDHPDNETTEGKKDGATDQSSEVTIKKDEKTTTEQIILSRRPTLRPTLLRLALTVVLGSVILIPLLTAEELLGSTAATQLGAIIVALLLFVAVGRLLIEVLVLRKTKYLLSEQGIKRQYSLLGYTKTQEVTYGLIRSTELEQKRLQYLFSVSTISLNQGLGHLRLSAVPDYKEFYDEIRNRVRESVADKEQYRNGR